MFRNEVVVLEDEFGLFLVASTDGVAVDVGEGFGNNGDEQVEEHDHVEDSAHEEENPNEDHGDGTEGAGVEVSQDHSVGVEEGVNEVSGEHVVSLVSTGNAREGVSEGADHNEQNYQEGSHVNRHLHDHANQVTSALEDP